MPTELKVTRIDGEIPTTGIHESEIERQGESLTEAVELREVINKQDQSIVRGNVYAETIGREPTLKPDIRSREHALQIDKRHNIEIVDNNPSEQPVESQSFVKSDIGVIYIIGEYLIYSNDNPRIPVIIERNVGINLEEIDITEEHLQDLFSERKSATWTNIDPETESATVTGMIDEDEPFDRQGILKWAIGVPSFEGYECNVGVSVDKNSIVIYGDVEGTQAAELAIEIISN